MALVLSLPPGIVSHTPGVRVVARQRLTTAIRQQVVARFNAERSNYASVCDFARVEKLRLDGQGITVSVDSLRVLLTRAQGQPQPLFRWEQMLVQFRKRNPRQPPGDWYWHDPGDFFPLCRTQAKFSSDLCRLQRRGYIVRKRPAAYEAKRARGWAFEYRLIEAST